MNTGRSDLMANSMQLLASILDTHNEIINDVSEELLCSCIDLMKSTNSEIHSKALKFVSECFSQDDPRNIEIGLGRDVLNNYHQLLQSPQT